MNRNRHRIVAVATVLSLLCISSLRFANAQHRQRANSYDPAITRTRQELQRIDKMLADNLADMKKLFLKMGLDTGGATAKLAGEDALSEQSQISKKLY